MIFPHRPSAGLEAPKHHKVMSIFLDDLQAGRDAQSGEASLILRYAPWLAICARESSKA